MTELGSKDYVFIGYNVKYGNAMGTLKNIPDSQKIETPVAENLMSGLAIGLSFENMFRSISARIVLDWIFAPMAVLPSSVGVVQ
jgi:pyruvate/2-oxoglutarate/acetoin dehydrogenase E1 component